ncbi:MAG TPA: glycosyltransferase, partial [Gaiellales bacterium]|nr:glycosyltransferase [Gaiellales bacterium]
MAAAELPVRVLMLHSRYSTGASSGENRVVEDEADLLRARGHDVILWSPEPDGGGAAGRARMAASAVWSVRAMRTLRDLLGRHRPDVVHAHNLFPMVSPAVLRVSGPPAVVTLHNYRLLCLPATFLRDGRTCESCLGRSPIQGVVHRCYRGSAVGSAALAASLSLHRRAGTFDRVATYIAVSDFVKAKHVEAGWPAERIVVKPNFARPARRRQGPGESFL